MATLTANRAAWIVSAALLVTLECTPGGTVPGLGQRFTSIGAVGRPELSGDEVRQALAQRMRVAPVPARETLTAFYGGNGQRLVWFDESGAFRREARILVDVLRRAEEHGLDPEDYAMSRIEPLAARSGKRALDTATASRLADFDLLLTSAFLRYASDVSTGRIHPDEVRSDWHTNPPELDLPTELDEALASDSLEELLDALPPPHEDYSRLSEALKELREAAAAGGWAAIPEGSTLEPGSVGPRVALLRQRLAPHDAGAVDSFDETLTEAVRHFQELHGIEPDGKVGEETLTELNVPVEQRIRQVELNLERWRWIPRQLGDPHVLVNIPGFDLEVVKDGAVAWRTRIVAGQAYTPTPVFSDRIVEVVANPPWNVPESIATKEYLPEIQKDPADFERRGFRLLEGQGDDARVVDLASVDLQALDAAHFPYRMRQDPGPNNALGRLKFYLTNDFHIYLHDTPSRSLFNRTDRDLSHGCIRVERPLELAAALLDESSQDVLREALDQTEQRHIPVDPAVPVHILYLTAWADEVGVLHFAPDIYGFDKPQRAALDRRASGVQGG